MSTSLDRIGENLAQLARELDRLVVEYNSLSKQAAVAKAEAEKAYARAFLEAQGPMDARHQQAKLAAADERWRADLADRQVASTKEAIRALHARLDVGRTMAASTRAEASLAQSGATP